MKKIYKTLIFATVIFISIFMLSSIKIKADTGPKPYVSIKVIGEKEGYYMTLLSLNESSGPHSSHKADNTSNIDEIDLKFASYVDSDNYYYLYYYKDISKDDFKWGYYPPTNFKILIYDSVNDRFITDNVKYERTSFATAFVLKLDVESEVPFTINKGLYEELHITIGFVLRLILCLVIEASIALRFKIKGKQMAVIIYANIFTQVLLNLVLALFIHSYGLNALLIIPLYIAGEVFILLFEWMIYILFINKVDNSNKQSVSKLFLYSFSANLASLILGFVVMLLLGY